MEIPPPVPTHSFSSSHSHHHHHPLLPFRTSNALSYPPSFMEFLAIETKSYQQLTGPVQEKEVERVDAKRESGEREAEGEDEEAEERDSTRAGGIKR